MRLGQDASRLPLFLGMCHITTRFKPHLQRCQSVAHAASLWIDGGMGTSLPARSQYQYQNQCQKSQSHPRGLGA